MGTANGNGGDVVVNFPTHSHEEGCPDCKDLTELGEIVVERYGDLPGSQIAHKLIQLAYGFCEEDVGHDQTIANFMGFITERAQTMASAMEGDPEEEDGDDG